MIGQPHRVSLHPCFRECYTPLSQAPPAEHVPRSPRRCAAILCASEWNLAAMMCSCLRAGTGQLITMRHVTEQFIGNAGHRSWIKSRRRVLRYCIWPFSSSRFTCIAAGPTRMHCHVVMLALQHCHTAHRWEGAYIQRLMMQTDWGPPISPHDTIHLHRRFEENDLPLLTRLRETMPNDTRIAFYRAHTLWAMHRFQDAYAAYEARLHMANVSRSNPVSRRPALRRYCTLHDHATHAAKPFYFAWRADVLHPCRSTTPPSSLLHCSVTASVCSRWDGLIGGNGSIRQMIPETVAEILTDLSCAARAAVRAVRGAHEAGQLPGPAWQRPAGQVPGGCRAPPGTRRAPLRVRVSHACGQAEAPKLNPQDRCQSHWMLKQLCHKHQPAQDVP